MLENASEGELELYLITVQRVWRFHGKIASLKKKQLKMESKEHRYHLIKALGSQDVDEKCYSYDLTNPDMDSDPSALPPKPSPLTLKIHIVYNTEQTGKVTFLLSQHDYIYMYN